MSHGIPPGKVKDAREMIGCDAVVDRRKASRLDASGGLFADERLPRCMASCRTDGKLNCKVQGSHGKHLREQASRGNKLLR